MTASRRLVPVVVSIGLGAALLITSGPGSEAARQQPRLLPARVHRAPEPCRAGMKLVDARFCVDAFEASTVEVRDDGTTAPHSPFLPVKGLRVRAVSEPRVIPQAYINRNEAQAACAEAGKRLCTDAEWVTACKGPELTRYPYGNERKRGACVDTRRVSPLDRIFHGAERYGYKPMNDPRLNQLADTLAPTGTFSACTNAFEVYDMVGNVHEWTDDPAGTFRGGYYLDTRINGEGCDYRTVAHQATYHDYSTGFRCCSERSVTRPSARD
jgi:sulfatase modifying factor 1